MQVDAGFSAQIIEVTCVQLTSSASALVMTRPDKAGILIGRQAGRLESEIDAPTKASGVWFGIVWSQLPVVAGLGTALPSIRKSPNSQQGHGVLWTFPRGLAVRGGGSMVWYNGGNQTWDISVIFEA
jgi:hypothetical protein